MSCANNSCGDAPIGSTPPPEPGSPCAPAIIPATTADMVQALQSKCCATETKINNFNILVSKLRNKNAKLEQEITIIKRSIANLIPTTQAASTTTITQDSSPGMSWYNRMIPLYNGHTTLVNFLWDNCSPPDPHPVYGLRAILDIYQVLAGSGGTQIGFHINGSLYQYLYTGVAGGADSTRYTADIAANSGGAFTLQGVTYQGSPTLATASVYLRGFYGK